MRRFQQTFTQIEMDLDVFGKKKMIAADLLYLCVEYLQVPRETVGGRFELVPLVDPQTQHSAFSLPAHTLAPLLGLLSLEQSATIWGPGQEQAGNSRTSQN